MATDTASKSTKMLTEIVQIWYMLLHEKPGVVVLSTSAKHPKVWKVASAVIRLKSETILDANTRIFLLLFSFLYDHFIKYNHSIENVTITPVEILSKQPGDSKNDMKKNADFRPNSTGWSDYRHRILLALMTRSTNKGIYHPFAQTLTSSH